MAESANLTTEDALQRLERIRTQVQQTLQRCQNAPYPTSDRSRKVEEFQDQVRAIGDRAAKMVRALEGPSNERVEGLERERQAKQQALQDVDRRAQDLQASFQAKRNEYKVKISQAPTLGQNVAPLQAELKKYEAQHQVDQAKVNTERTEINSEFNELGQQLNEERAKLKTDAQKIRLQPAPEDLLAEADAMASVLDQVGELEREIATGASVKLVEDATAEFRDNTQDFIEAETYHRNESRWTFWALAVVLLLAAAFIAVLFIFPDLITSWAMSSEPMSGDSTTKGDGFMRVEKLVVLASGRLAILFFLAWVVKYLAGLHSAHSEQAVIYRDRRAALGVAELLLKATPELQQKREILQKLSEVYLEVGSSAFSSEKASTFSKGKGDDLDETVKKLKTVVSAVEPLAEAIGKASSVRK